MARPSAASSSTEPRLTPLNTALRRSPQTSEPSMLAMEATIAAFTSASVSSARRWLSSSLVSGLRLSPSSRAATRRLALSALPSMLAARTSSSCALIFGWVSAASAFSTSGSRDSSGSLNSACAASARTASSLLPSLSAACAASSAPRIRLLLTTSSAVSGTLSSAPVTGS